MPPMTSEAEQDDGGLLEADAAEEEAADKDGEIGEGGAEVGLLEDERDGDADQGEGFADVVQVSSLPGAAPEEAGHGDDEDELDPLGGLEVDAAAEVDPAARAEDFGADERTAMQRDDADAVGPVDDVDEAVVVDQRDEEHEDDADGEEADLLLVEAWNLVSRVADLISRTEMSESRRTKPRRTQSKSR